MCESYISHFENPAHPNSFTVKYFAHYNVLQPIYRKKKIKVIQTGKLLWPYVTMTWAHEEVVVAGDSRDA
jgi:predicted SnoaL-like aldol condensation-catalyzing enzyme